MGVKKHGAGFNALREKRNRDLLGNVSIMGYNDVKDKNEIFIRIVFVGIISRGG